MLTVALVASLAAGALWQQWRSVEIESAERARVQSFWVLTGALDWARLILREDARAGGADHLAEPWAVPLEEARLSTFLASDKNNLSDSESSASQAFLSYLNVENGGATLLSLGDLRFGPRPFFDDADLACIFRAKELRGLAFGVTFAAGIAAIALGLFMAADDFTSARRAVIGGAWAAFFACTLLSLLARFFFPTIAPLLLGFMAGPACDPAATSGLPLIFPAVIFQDGLVLLALFTRFGAVAIALAAWLFGRLLTLRPHN